MGKIKVLMVDDNVNLTEMVKDYFKKNSNLEISKCCYDGEEALNLIKNEEFDVVLFSIS